MTVKWTITNVKVSQTPEVNTAVELDYSVGIEDNSGTIGVTRSGTVPLDPPTGTFIEISDLTEQQCLEWLWEKVSKESTEDVLYKQAGSESAKLPWKPQEEDQPV
jgi:hypothetical protein